MDLQSRDVFSPAFLNGDGISKSEKHLFFVEYVCRLKPEVHYGMHKNNSFLMKPFCLRCNITSGYKPWTEMVQWPDVVMLEPIVVRSYYSVECIYSPIIGKTFFKPEKKPSSNYSYKNKAAVLESSSRAPLGRRTISIIEPQAFSWEETVDKGLESKAEWSQQRTSP